MAQPVPDPFRRLTDSAHAVVVLAHGQAQRLGHGHVTPEHLLLAITVADESIASMVLAALGISPRMLREQVEQGLPPGQPVISKHVVTSHRTDQVLQRAQLYAGWLGHEFVATDHLLAAIGEIDGPARDILTGFGATPNRVATEALRLLTRYTRGRPQPGHEPCADQLIGARRLAVPTALGEFNTKITEARRQKTAAVDNHDYDRAGQIRQSEKQLLAERQQLVRGWVAEVDLVLLVNELDRLYQETERLRGLLASPERPDGEDALDVPGQP